MDSILVIKISSGNTIKYDVFMNEALNSICEKSIFHTGIVWEWESKLAESAHAIGESKRLQVPW